MAEHNDLGKWGEAEASRYLESKGYAILDRDWRFGKRDLDIVALSEDACTMVVVEVKTRASDDMRAPERLLIYVKCVILPWQPMLMSRDMQ